MSRSAGPGRMPKVRVNRDVPPPALQPFTDYFKGFEKVGAVRRVFGDETEAVLSRLKIGFISNRQMYMGIRDHDGNIAVGTYHLRHSDERVLYLDVVHELFHIKQWMGDKAWFTREHEKFMGNFDLYYSSPLEVPAYAHTVREAERLGMTRKEIAEYLKMMPVPPRTWNRFIKEMAIRPLARAEARAGGLPPVKINRTPKLVLHPFTDYFQGFEDSPPVRSLFGSGAEKALRAVKVEFLESPFGSIFPSEEDGHLVVNRAFVKEAGLEAIYLDVVASLSLLAAMGAAAKARGRSEFGEPPLVLQSYTTMVQEARRIGVPDARVMDRLQLPAFTMGEREFAEFVRALGLEPKKGAAGLG
ncbi:MAG: hypothetical protein JRN23_01135 [Nitrososphaerota archaeon]|nr:hypothetical protein [Nitrososphaerota archaeon]MDG6978219.1 hypothetical protein [Nitrososphaerota archaeon]MDG7020516.1 hypothetical protein [Nitrososphaerota archaeon]